MGVASMNLTSLYIWREGREEMTMREREREIGGRFGMCCILPLNKYLYLRKAKRTVISSY